MNLTATAAMPLPYRERHFLFDRRRGAQVWSDGARLAVFVYIAAEAWLWDRQEESAPRYTRRVVGERVPSLSTCSAVRYGLEIGLRRLRDILQDQNIRVTPGVGGTAVEQHPEPILEMAKMGYEISAHSYSRGLPLSLMTADDQWWGQRFCEDCNL